MKSKKSFIALILIFAILTITLSACKTDEQGYEFSDIKIVVPDGAPSLSMAKLMKDGKSIQGTQIVFDIVAGVDEIMAKVTKGEADIAIVPTNIAALLYNKGVDIQMVSVNVFGLLYMVGRGEATSLSALKGEIVYNIGRGGTPDLTFKYILKSNGIEYIESDEAVSDKVSLKYVSGGSELISLLAKGAAKYGILGEPAASQAVKKTGASVLFDIQKLWNSATNTTEGIPQACLIVKKKIIEQIPEFVDELLAELVIGASWIKDNAGELNAILTENNSALKMNYDKTIVENCNIGLIKAQDIKPDVNNYLSILYGFNPQSIGGKIPDDNFYRKA
ncbi:MAG: ABC transporter substrate-binding protein [Clostridia bacterium]